MDDTEEDREGRVTALTVDVDMSPLNVEMKVFKNASENVYMSPVVPSDLPRTGLFSQLSKLAHRYFRGTEIDCFRTVG